MKSVISKVIFIVLAMITIAFSVLAYDYWQFRTESDRVLNEMQAKQREFPPEGFLKVGKESLPNDCIYIYDRFTDRSSYYSYHCGNVDRNKNLNIAEVRGELLDVRVKSETESDVQDLRITEEFTHLDVKGVIVTTFGFDGLTPVEYRLYWPHGENLFSIHTNNIELFTPEQLINILMNMTK